MKDVSASRIGLRANNVYCSSMVKGCIIQISIWAAVALELEEEPREFFTAFAERRDVFHSLLEEIPGINAPKPEGAFYILADITATGMDDIEFATRALEEAEVQVVPGSLMPGGEGLIRMSYGTSLEQIREGCKRLKNWLEG